MEKCKSSNEALQLLVRVSETLHFHDTEVEEAVRKLHDHFLIEEESAVRVKILALMVDIAEACPTADLVHMIEQSIVLLKSDSSHAVIAQGLLTILRLSSKLSQRSLHMNLITIAENYLKDTSHQVFDTSVTPCISIF